jgi:hypothetical protein
MLSNHLKNLPTFNGNQNEDVNQWLKDVTDGLNYVKFTDDQKISIISGYLNGDARRWLLGNVCSGFAVLDSWSTFIQEIKNEFTPTLLTEDDVSQLNQCVHALEQTTVYYDDEMKTEQKCELLGEKETYLSDSHILLVELNKVDSPNMRILENSESNCESVWPDGHESWFLHDALPQRCRFIRPKQPEVLFNSTSNIDDDFVQENLSNCINVLLSSVMNDTYISASYNIKAVGNLFQLHAIYNDVIPFFLFLGELPPIINTYRRIFTRNTAGSYAGYNVLRCDTEDRYWFRRLAVP